MLAHIEAGGPPVESSIAQLAADQWDPKGMLASSVVEAEQKYCAAMLRE